MTVPDVWEKGPSASGFVAAVLFVMLVCLCVSWKSPEIIMFAALVTVWNANIITTPEALGGFSNTGMLAVGALFVVVAGVERSQIADKAARIVFGVESSMRMAMLRMMLLVFVLSAFFNNTPIVALFIPIVRDFCRTRGFSPSKFLIPLSFAVVSGGVITMIGTSTNLVVNGILSDAGYDQFNFFAPAPICVPVGLIAIFYIFCVGPALLPDRVGLFGFIRDRADELLTEIEITEGFPYAGSSVRAVLAKLELTPEAIIKIRRPGTEGTLKRAPSSRVPIRSQKSLAALWGNKRTDDPEAVKTVDDESRHYFNAEGQYADIYPVNIVTETVQLGDVLFLSGPSSIIMKFTGATSTNKVPGLRFLQSNPVDLVGIGGQEFYEVVLGDRNLSIGKVVSDASFGKYYNCTVIAVRPRGVVDGNLSHINSITDHEETKSQAERVALNAGKDPKHADADLREKDLKTEIKGRRLVAGDAILVLAPNDFEAKWARSSDFFVISKVGTLPGEVRYWDYVPLVLFAGMIAWVTTEKADMSRAAMAVGTILCLFGWVSSRKAVSYVDWGLLLLIGSALGLSKAITASGLAGYVGEGIKNAGIGAWPTLWLLYIFCMILTEIVTNNAAAALAAPIALSVAEALDVSFEPFAMVVLISASTAYLTPIGYQTNLMVWAPGGYTFLDFTRLGIGMNLIYLVGVCLLVPAFYPF